ALRTLFVNDSSSARPDGSMQVKDIFWFKHSSKIGDVSSAKVFELLKYEKIDAVESSTTYEDYNIHLDEERLDEFRQKGLEVEIIEGM
ncbi:MAG: type I CRISPR-associated protein Cas7, partial [Helcococcus sp.]|nr:type I CRISPR-associated protein Cas7 [Helcococcus sp.]